MVDFIQLLKRLSDYQVEYVLVGGLAAATYGSSLVTQDVDVCVNLELANLIRLKKSCYRFESSSPIDAESS